MPNAARSTVTVSRTQIEDELRALERALEMATERQHVAEQALWRTISRSGHVAVPSEQLEEVRREVTDADREQHEAEALVADLRSQLQEAQLRESRLLLITDMLMAGDKARRSNAAHEKLAVGPGPVRRKPGGWRSFLRWLRRR